MRVENTDIADQGDDNNNTDVVKSGDLAVTATAATDRKVVVNDTLEVVSDTDTLTFKSSEDVTISKIVLERYGYSTADDVAEVSLEDQEGNTIADGRTINNKDRVSLSLKKDYKTVDGVFEATVVVKMATGDASKGGTIGFKVVDVESTAKNLNLDNYKPYTYDMVAYSGTTVTLQMKGSTRTYNYEAGKSYELARLKIDRLTSYISLNGFTLTNTGSDKVDLVRYLDKLTVTKDGEKVSGLKFKTTKDDEIVVTFDSIELPINKTATFVIEGSFNEDFDDYNKHVALVVDESSDFKATEKKTGARLTVKPATTPVVKTFNGGKIKLTSTKLSNVDVPQGGEGYVVAEGNITITEPVKTTFTIDAGKTGLNNMVFIVAGEEYEGKISADKKSFEFKNVVIEKGGKVQFKVDVDETAATGTVYSISAFGSDAFSNARYENTRKDVKTDDVIGTIAFAKVTVQESKGSLTNSLTKKVEFKVNESNTKTVFDGTYTAKKGLVRLNNVEIENVTGTLAAKDDVMFTVTIDGEEVATINGTGDQDFSPITVEAGKSVKVVVVADVFASAANSKLEYKVTLKGEDENSNPAGSASKAMVAMSFVDNDSITVTTTSSMKRQDVVLANRDQNMATFSVKPSNNASTANLDKLVFSLGTSSETMVKTIKANDNGGLLKDMDASEHFDVLIGGVPADNLEFLPGANAQLEVSNINVDLEGETEVKVVYKGVLYTGDYTITLTTVNNETNLNRVFDRKSVNALVRVATQEGESASESKYTFDIDFSDDAINTSIKSVKFAYKNAIVALSGDSYKEWYDVQEGETYNVPNNEVVNYVTAIEYVDGDNNPVNIDSTYADFFKVGKEDLKAFSSK